MMQFRNLVQLCAVVVLIAYPQIANAADKIAFVDIQKALTSTRAGQDAQKKYEVQLKKAQSDIDVKKGEFERQRQNFAKQKESLNAKTLSERQEQLINMEKDLKRAFEDSQDELRRENGRLVSELVKKMRTIVAAYGEEKGYTLVVERNAPSVLYVSPSIDITGEVVKRFDSQN